MTPGLVKLELGKVDSAARWFVAHIVATNKRGPGIKFSSTIEPFEVIGNDGSAPKEDLLLLTIRFEPDCRPMAIAYLLSALTEYCRKQGHLRDQTTYDRERRVFTCLLGQKANVDRCQNGSLVVGPRLWHVRLMSDALQPALAKHGAAWELFDLRREEPPTRDHELRAS